MVKLLRTELVLGSKFMVSLALSLGTGQMSRTRSRGLRCTYLLTRSRGLGLGAREGDLE